MDIHAEKKECALLSAAFANAPSQEQIVRFDPSAFEGAPDARRDAARLIAADAERLDEPLHRAIRVDYTRICCGTEAGAPLPYRSVYEGPDRLFMRDCCLRVAELYRPFGFDPCERGSNEPADFLPTMLDCLAFLYGKALDAPAAEAERWRKRADAFRQEHLGAWVERYCSEAAPLADTGYYRGMLALLAAFARRR